MENMTERQALDYLDDNFDRGVDLLYFHNNGDKEQYKKFAVDMLEGDIAVSYSDRPIQVAQAYLSPPQIVSLAQKHKKMKGK